MSFVVTVGLWLAWPLVCFFVVRKLSNALVRAGITGFGCVALLAWSFRDVPPDGSMDMMLGALFGMLLCSCLLCRLVSASERERKAQSLWDFLLQLLWVFVPICVRKAPPRRFPQLLLSVASLLALAAVKFTVLKSLDRWLLRCLDQRASSPPMTYAVKTQYSALLLLSFFLSFFTLDVLAAVVSLLSLDRLQWFTVLDWPLLSASPREFWGRRYNRIVSKLLRESVFEPLRQQAGWPPAAAALATFLMSGLLHGYWVFVGFHRYDGIVRSIAFFLLQGLASSAFFTAFFERLPRPIAILLTHLQLVLCAPIFLGLFVESGPKFLQSLDPRMPAFVHLPIPDYCPGE
jgi:hypothetical protein